MHALTNWPFWSSVQVLKLTQNMWSHSNANVSEFLLRVGDGIKPTILDDFIRIPPSMSIQWQDDMSIYCLIDATFPNLSESIHDGSYFISRALLAPTNVEVDKLYDEIIQSFPGEAHTYYSFDSVSDDSGHMYQQEYLNSISPGGMPPHVLTLKKGAPIMLLRNIEPKVGLCNGTRLICVDFLPNVIYAEVLTGHTRGLRVFIPRISLKTSESLNFPFEMTRKQFLVRLSFALTINKAQGQTIHTIGIYLSDHVVCHRQLYVALSRGVSMASTKVLVRKGSIRDENGTHTWNVIYKDVLLP